MHLQHFVEYIRDVRGVSESSLRSYVGALHTINTLLEKYHFAIPNLFLTTGIDELDEIRSFLEQNAEFQEKDATGHRMYSVAFKHYYRFSLWYKN